MKKIYLTIFIFSLLKSMTFNTSFGTIIIDDQNVIENPFYGGYNKPRIQWVDWDGDNDEDLFLLDEDGSIKYYNNQGCFQYDCSFELITSMFQEIKNISWFHIADFDQDNYFEIVTQNPEQLNSMIYYENISDNLYELTAVGSIFDDENNFVESDPVMVPTFIDIDDDGDLDFFTGNVVGTVTFYENLGFIDGAPTFEFISNFWQEIFIVGSSANQRHGASAITFIDLDEDGDFDLTWGDYFQQSLYVIWNVGDSSEPIMDNLNIISQFPENNPIFSAGLNMPSFSDFDNDGDKDLFITVLSGAYGFQLTNNFFLFENNQDFQQVTSNFIETLDFLSDINPEFADIDHDGDLDLFLGTDFDPSSFPWSGRVIYFENIGNDENEEPIWLYVNGDILNGTEGNNFSPEFSDFDLDGDLDIIVGDFNGKIKYYENQSTSNDIIFSYIDDFENIDLSGYANPELIDIDNDNDNDLFIGDLNGKINFYENIGSNSNPIFELSSDNYFGININYRANPKFYDYDDDNDYDLFLGSGYDNVKLYKNLGNEYAAEFNEEQGIEIPYLGLNVSPEVYVSNNIVALVAGVSTGGMYFLPFDNYIIGDITNDSIVNIFDIVILVEYILFDENNNINFIYLDVNNDGLINILDVIELVELVLTF